MPQISPQAIVEKTAQLADDVRIGPFCYIGPQVRLGGGCVVENNVTIIGRTTLGAHNHVFPMSQIGACPDGGPNNAAGQCVIGDANSIREHVTIYGGPAAPTRIGADNLFMIDCQVGSGATIGDHCIFANCTQVAAGARLEDFIQTSSFVAVEPDVRVGAYTFIVAFAGVDRDVPPFAMVQGYPFRVRGVNSQKLQRCGFGSEDIQTLKEVFRELYNGHSDQPNAEVLRRLASQGGLNPHVRRLLDGLAPDAGRPQ